MATTKRRITRAVVLGGILGMWVAIYLLAVQPVTSHPLGLFLSFISCVVTMVAMWIRLGDYGA